MTLEEAIFMAVEQGPGSPRQILGRLEWRVRELLDSLADTGKIERVRTFEMDVEKLYGPKRRLAAVLTA